MNRKFQPLFFFILVINHLVGIVGLNSPYVADFELVSWINLILSFVFIISFHQPLHQRFWSYASLVFLIGMAVEILGINTGIPFGKYFYTERFGPMAFGVPLIIGFNWLLLTYCTASVIGRLKVSKWFKILFAANLMTALDLLLEPFAIRHGFWVWLDGVPPIQNFVAWWAVAVLMQWMLYRFAIVVDNQIARWYVLLLAMFLMADLVLSKFKVNLLEHFF